MGFVIQAGRVYDPHGNERDVGHLGRVQNAEGPAVLRGFAGHVTTGASAHLDGVGPEPRDDSPARDRVEGHGDVACRKDIGCARGREPVHHDPAIHADISGIDRGDVRLHALADTDHFTVEHAAVVQQYSGDAALLGQNADGGGPGLNFQSRFVQCVADQDGISGFHQLRKDLGRFDHHGDLEPAFQKGKGCLEIQHPAAQHHGAASPGDAFFRGPRIRQGPKGEHAFGIGPLDFGRDIGTAAGRYEQPVVGKPLASGLDRLGSAVYPLDPRVYPHVDTGAPVGSLSQERHIGRALPAAYEKRYERPEVGQVGFLGKNGDRPAPVGCANGLGGRHSGRAGPHDHIAFLPWRHFYLPCVPSI